MHATGTGFSEAVEAIQQWLGEPVTKNRPIIRPQEESERQMCFPLLEKPTQVEITRLWELRQISPRALCEAVARGFPWTYKDRLENCRGWLITDSARRSAIARRLDGLPWQAPWCKDAKSQLIQGSWGAWPIGIAEAADYGTLIMTEGMPDFLSLIQLRPQFAPICMASASMKIPQSVLPRFGGKRIWICAHNDKAGMGAALRWKEQLGEVATADIYECQGDLNEMVGGKL